MTKLIGLLIALSLWVALDEQELETGAPDPDLALAERYLAAYAALDFDRLEGFWTEDSVWRDPTSAEIGASPDPVRGAAAIRAHLVAATGGIAALELELDERFRSGGHVVHVGTLRYTLDGAAIGAPGKDLPFELRTVIVLELKHGKVLGHTDYADFSDWHAQLRAGLAR